MKRRILALALAIMMLCPMVLTGCNSGSSTDSGDQLNETATRETVTLTMWVVTDKNTTDEAKRLVEEEFNTITKSTFTTAVDLIFVTPEEYAQALNDKFAAAAEAKANSTGKNKVTETGEVEVEMETNQYGVTVLKYPEVTDDQIDIVFVQGFDQLYDLVSAGRLESLNDYISETGKSKILTDVIPASLLTHTKINGITYAIPNNRVVGEYTYLLVKKDIVTGDANGDGTISSDEIRGSYINIENISTSNMESFKECYKIIEYVKQNRTDLAPLLEQYENPYMYYWGNDSGFSVLGSKDSNTAMSQSESVFTYFPISNSLTQNKEHIVKMFEYQLGGYFAANKEDAMSAQNFGVAVLKGDSTIVDQFGENYYIKAISTPTVTDRNAFGSFYGVTTFSKNKDRAMEIITMLNTTSELRNLLQYGVEGVHYELDEDDRVDRFNNDYIMDIYNTGNIFTAYPEEDMPDDVWVRGVASNLDLRVHATTGVWEYLRKIDPKVMADLAELSTKYEADVEALFASCTTVEDFSMQFELKSLALEGETAYKKAKEEVKKQYEEWYTSHKKWQLPQGDGPAA